MAEAKLVFAFKFLISVFFRTQFSVWETGTSVIPNHCMMPETVSRKAEGGVHAKKGKKDHRNVLK